MAWWSTEEEPSPQSRVGASRRPVEEEAAGRVRAPRRFTGFPRPSGIALIVVVGVVVVVAIPVFTIVTALDEVDDAFDSPSGVSGGGESGDGPSLVRPDRFEPALEKVKREAGPEGSVVALRLDPDRLSVVLRKADGSGAVVIVSRDLDVTRVGSGGSAGSRGLSLNRIDPAVPERLVRAAAERIGRRVDDLSYLALVPSSGFKGGASWAVFFGSGGGPVIADLDGSHTRLPGQ
jgi:hypothetical protein